MPDDAQDIQKEIDALNRELNNAMALNSAPFAMAWRAMCEHLATIKKSTYARIVPGCSGEDYAYCMGRVAMLDEIITAPETIIEGIDVRLKERAAQLEKLKSQREQQSAFDEEK